MRFRKLKEQIRDLLAHPDFSNALDEISRYDPRQAVNPLFSFFLHPDESIRWRSISAMGRVTAVTYEGDRKEDARIVMRRLLWSLNDESGGIGWGAPEAMGAAMSESQGLAAEYSSLLTSYIIPHGNYLEHPVLQRGVLWGIAQLAHAFPEHVRPSVAYLVPFLTSDDPYHRGLAAWTAALYDHPQIRACLPQIRKDRTTFVLYRTGDLQTVTVASMVPEAARP